MSQPILRVRNLTLRRDDGQGSALLNDIKLDLFESDILILKGRSGSGKSTLLKCIAELIPYQQGRIELYGREPADYGLPTYRTKALYIPQRPSLLPGSPAQFLETILSFRSRQPKITASPHSHNATSLGATLDRCMGLAAEWGIEKYLWNRDWATLSGGEGQRMSLAIGLGIGGAEVVLLDEPTSALDSGTTRLVESSIANLLRKNDHVGKDTLGPKAIIWITHEDAQANRVGTRVMDITPTA